MMWILGVTLVIFLAGLVLVNGMGKQSRPQFLKELENFLEGKMEPADDKKNGYKITFSIDGVEMVYEDFPEVGFEDQAFRGCLRCPIGFKYTVNFTEKERKRSLGSGMVTVSDKSTDMALQERVYVKFPEKLNMFNVFTDNVELTNAILFDRECLDLFIKYKNIDATGYPIMSLRIINGEVLLDFHSIGSLKPSIDEIRSDKAKMDGYIDDVKKLVQKIRDTK
jgi:hypothetical protein